MKIAVQPLEHAGAKFANYGSQVFLYSSGVAECGGKFLPPSFIRLLDSIELSDILGIEFECKHCKGKVALSLDTTRSFPDCPLCGEEWFSNGSIENTSISRLLNIFKNSQAATKGSKDVLLRIHIAAPPQP
jgi:hypothetical protein